MLGKIRTYSPRRKIQLLAVVALVALGALGGTAIAGGFSTSPPKAMLRVAHNPSTAAMSQMASAYPVLGRAQQPTDLPPTHDQSQWVMSQGGTVANTRRALVTPSGQSIYLVAASGYLCMESDDMAGCGVYPSTTPQRLIAVGTTLCNPNLPSNEIQVQAIMPPGTSNVAMHYSDGSSTSLTPTNGVIAVTALASRPLPDEITWTGSNGPEKSWTGVPPNTSSTPCAS
jgi:hypothetical protein